MNSTPTTARRNKKDNHIWTPIEDAFLVEALNELCVGGYWKVDNGFRSGYLGQLEKAMEQKLPGCGLKAVPHIESCVKTLKKQTLAISDMLTNSSGFAWNDEEKMVVCKKQVFDDWVKVHNSAKGLRNKPFPHYDTLVEVFGKDRANGKGAEGPAEVIEDLTDNNTFNFEGDGLGDMASTLRSFVDMTKTHLETMKWVLMSENATSERRAKIVDELQKIQGLSDMDFIDAAAAIISDDAKIDLLFTLPDNLKIQWVKKLLHQY
ncbi:PREDICTED: At2g29880 [Prunus dulcis]|uniref:PREDICTED: At2g29880 n=1 Tax=Prunus dulcis TaxID=3755 RepID=A0A5E4FL81_PRUDU|nr:PREDICTED: At2g29880 [Prunus dulcis]